MDPLPMFTGTIQYRGWLPRFERVRTRDWICFWSFGDLQNAYKYGTWEHSLTPLFGRVPDLPHRQVTPKQNTSEECWKCWQGSAASAVLQSKAAQSWRTMQTHWSC